MVLLEAVAVAAVVIDLLSQASLQVVARLQSLHFLLLREITQSPLVLAARAAVIRRLMRRKAATLFSEA